MLRDSARTRLMRPMLGDLVPFSDVYDKSFLPAQVPFRREPTESNGTATMLKREFEFIEPRNSGLCTRTDGSLQIVGKEGDWRLNQPTRGGPVA
jgi:hypothetical protein